MLPVTALKDMFPVIMTPSHDGKYFHNYTVSLLNLVIEAQKIGMSLQVVLHRGESLITRARNDCVAKFLANPNGHTCFGLIPISVSVSKRRFVCYSPITILPPVCIRSNVKIGRRRASLLV